MQCSSEAGRAIPARWSLGSSQRIKKRMKDGGGRAPRTVQSLPLWDPEKSLIHVEFEINFIPRSHKILRSSFSLALVVCSYSADFQW